MNAPAIITAALDPIRALYIEAFDALIERRLADETSIIGGHAAFRLLQHLEGDCLAELKSDPSTGALRLTMFGISSRSTKASAYAILRQWQAAARARLANQL